MIKGSTQVVGIVGSPISQVMMPGNLNRYFRESDKDIVMVPFEVLPAGLATFVGLLRHAENFLGTVVTVPHKQAFSRQVDVISDRAKAIGAVNVVRRCPDGTLHGDHVDGLGFLNAARAHGFQPFGKRALIAGAGGAGSALAYTLCELGIKDLCILDPDAMRLGNLLDTLRASFPGVLIQSNCTDFSGYDLVANVTPLGMRQTDPLPLPAELLRTLNSHVLVGDAVTSPIITPFLQFAQEKGCRILTGAEMSSASMEFVGSFLRIMPVIDPMAAFSAALAPGAEFPFNPRRRTDGGSAT